MTPDLSKLSIDRNPRALAPRRRRRWLNKWTIGALVAVLIGVLVAVKSANAPVSVELATVTTAYPTASFTELNATGRVSAARKAAVSTKATGRLEWLGVQEGSRVKAGQVIARLENLDVAASRDSAAAGANAARANLEQGEAELRDAKLNYERTQELFQRTADRPVCPSAHRCRRTTRRLHLFRSDRSSRFQPRRDSRPRDYPGSQSHGSLWCTERHFPLGGRRVSHSAR